MDKKKVHSKDKRQKCSGCEERREWMRKQAEKLRHVAEQTMRDIRSVSLNRPPVEVVEVSHISEAATDGAELSVLGQDQDQDTQDTHK